jgi:hypothetical protein
MEQQSKKVKGLSSKVRVNDTFDLDALLHPARAFAHPMDVVRDPDLTLNEKRAILASWASDACAVEAAPELRIAGSGKVVRWDDIMDALRTLDREADGYGKPLPHYKRVLAKKRAGLFRLSRFRSRRDRGDQGQLPN